jgi:predicted ribosomally synthesized peptide with nif11-like leader
MYEVAPSLDELSEAAQANAYLRGALRNAATPNEIIQVARSHGYDLTERDITMAIRASQYPSSALEDAELEAVATNASTNTATCANSCGCNSTETCSNCCRR